MERIRNDWLLLRNTEELTSYGICFDRSKRPDTASPYIVDSHCHTKYIKNWAGKPVATHKKEFLLKRAKLGDVALAFSLNLSALLKTSHKYVQRRGESHVIMEAASPLL